MPMGERILVSLVSQLQLPASKFLLLSDRDGSRPVDIKPDNLLANHASRERGAVGSRFGAIKLGDLGDSVRADIATNDGQHIISAPIYRAPEAMLNVPWTVAVDIWSLGATASWSASALFFGAKKKTLSVVTIPYSLTLHTSNR
jgi:serine/threonine protein kinase